MELRARSYTAGILLVAGSILEVVAMGHHPSVRTADVAAAVAGLTARGAKFLHDGQQGPHTWVTLADPEGNEFCVERSRRERDKA